jgi:hypothetical protein
MKFFSLTGVVSLALFSTTATAQLELPQPSPTASVSQRVGLTDVSIEYSSPAVNKRKIWGGLVPNDKPWRTGANASTKITFSRDVTIGGKAVPAGTYAVVSFPTAKGWTIALNSDTKTNGGPEYDPKKDVVRVTPKTSAIPHRERMTFVFSDTTESQTTLDLEWEKLRVSFPIVVDTKSHVDANIASALGGGWRMYSNAARYRLDNGGDLDEALRYVDTSIGIQSTWFNNWIKAQILFKKGAKDDAYKHVLLAKELGDKEPKGFFYKDAVEKALVEWKPKG